MDSRSEPPPAEPATWLRSPWLPVAVAGVLAAMLFALLTWAIVGPLVYLDELIYMDAATSLAAGDGLRFRDAGYGYGPVYPVIVGAIARLVDDRILVYHLALALNAVAVASAVVPAFLLARRIATPRVAVAAAIACLALPSTFYAAYLMTDALAYVLALWAVVALVRALEAPTPARDLGALAACGAATALRPQLVLLLPAFLLAVLLHALAGRLGLRRVLRSHWVAVVAAATTALVVVGAGVSGRGPELLGSYGVLWGSLDLLGSTQWTLYHVWDAVLYVWVVPALVLPSALGQLWKRARADPAAGAVVATVVAVSLGALVLDGVFSATRWAESRLHDRYLIFMFPLWVIVLVDWVTRRGVRDRRLTSLAALAVAALAVLVPYHGLVDIETPNVFDGVATTPWALLGDAIGTDGLVSARGVLLLVVAGGLALVLRAGDDRVRTATGVSFVLVGSVAAAQWMGAIAISDRGTFADTRSSTMLWVDRVAGERRVTTLFVGTEACNEESYLRAQLTTEFFNASVGPFVAVGRPFAHDDVRVRGDGTLVDVAGRAVTADLVLTFPGLRVAGRAAATGTTSRLRVWEVGGPIRLVGWRDERTLARACPGPGGALPGSSSG